MRAPWAVGDAAHATGMPGMPATVHPALRGVRPPPPASGPPSTFEWRGWSFNAPKGPILATQDADTYQPSAALPRHLACVQVRTCTCLCSVVCQDGLARHPCERARRADIPAPVAAGLQSWA